MQKAPRYCALVHENSDISRLPGYFRTICPVSVVLLSAIFTSACAVKPAQPEANGTQVSAISVSQVQNDSELFNAKGVQSDSSDKSIVRWGGTIARIENQAEQQTLLEIVSRPLSSGGRPQHNDSTDGRFFAMVPRFLDPEIVKVGRDVTVLGELDSLQSGKVGETDYMFPVVRVSDLRYWKKLVVVRPNHFPHWSIFPDRYDDPFWDRRYPRQHKHR